MRLIDADALLKREGLDNAFKQIENGRPYYKALETMMLYEIKEMLDDAPTIDAEPVRIGKWNDAFGELPSHAPYGWKCSFCDGIAFNEHSYCPNCGAKMEG